MQICWLFGYRVIKMKQEMTTAYMEHAQETAALFWNPWNHLYDYGKLTG